MARPTKTTRRRALPRGARKSGFTLIESLIASVILAFAVVCVAGSLAASHAQAIAMESNAVATSLARQLMEEIAARPLVTSDATAGWPSDTNRAHYDSINDYHGYTDTAPVAMLGGDTTTGVASGYTRTVSLSYPTTLFGAAVTAGDWVLITVSAHEPSGRGITLNKLVARATVLR